MVRIEKYFEIMLDRPKKLNEDDVEFEPAPEGSAMRCGSCINYYRRATDGRAVCQIFRSSEVDDHGVPPDWRCRFWTVTGDVFPLLPEEVISVLDTESVLG